MMPIHALAEAIIEEDVQAVRHLLHYSVDPNEIDQYGFTPLIEAAIVNNLVIAKMLIDYSADVNAQDMVGSTALHWAAENNNQAFCELLLKNKANPNVYTLSGQSPLVMPLLREQDSLKKLLMQQGADLIFAQDYINAKLLGHMFELVGTAHIVDPKNHFVEVDFEGFYLEFTLGILSESLVQFRNHFAARKVRHYSQFVDTMIETLQRAEQLIKYQHYLLDTQKYLSEIDQLIEVEPLLIPLGYEGHAITLIKYGDILIKCDRREDSRLYDNVMFYRIKNWQALTKEFIRDLIYEKQSGEFINHEIHRILNLQPITELKIAAQISGNCSWANVEATLPAVFFLLFSQSEDSDSKITTYKKLALDFFREWREWNKQRALQFCIQSFHESDPIRKACKAEILAAILFQSCQDEIVNQQYIDAILAVFINSPYQYILQNYIKVYCYEEHSDEGKNFLRLMKKHKIIP